jgi:hypothetical protein
MAVAFDNAQTVIGTAVTSLTTAAFTIGSGNNRAAVLGLCTSHLISSPSYSVGGVSGTLVTTKTDGGIMEVAVGVVVAPPSGSQTATASWTTSTDASLGVATFTGVDQTTTYNGVVTGSGSNNNTPTITVSSNSGDLAVGVFAVAQGLGSPLGVPNNSYEVDYSAGTFSNSGVYGSGAGSENLSLFAGPTFTAHYAVIALNLIQAASRVMAALDWPNPRRLVTPAAGFIGLNLLLASLGGFDQKPFAQTDWPVPKAAQAGVELRTFLNPLNKNLLGKDQFFTSPGRGPAYDYPNPRGYVPGIALRTHVQPVNLTLLGKDQFFTSAGRGPVYDYPNPRGYVPATELKTWIQPVSKELLSQDKFFGPPGMGPDYDWPNPRGYTPAIVLKTFIGPVPLNLLGQDKFFGPGGKAPVYDYPNPRGRASVAHQFDHANLALIIQPPALSPFSQDDWPNPGRGWPRLDQLSFTAPLNQNLLSQDQFFGPPGMVQDYDYPNPRGYVPVTELRTFNWQVNPNLLSQDTFYGAPGQVPANYDWPVPKGYTPSIALRTHVDPLKGLLQGKDQLYGAPGQVATYDWQNPRGYVPGMVLRTIAQASAFQFLQDSFYGAPGEPPPNYDWPVPRGPVGSIALRTHAEALKLALLGQDKFFTAAGMGPVYDYPNPRGYQRSVVLLTHAEVLKLNLLGQDQFFRGAGVGPVYNWPNPVRGRPASQFDHANLVAYLTIGIVKPPFYQTDWPNPRGPIASYDLRTWLDPFKINLQWIQFRSSFSNTADVGGTDSGIGILKPPGTLNTDVVLVGISCAGTGGSGTNASFIPPAGWTLVQKTVNGAEALLVYLGLGTSTFGSTWIASNVNGSISAAVASYSGVDNATPLDVAAAGQANAASNTVTTPSITTASPNAQIVCFYGWYDGGGGSTPNWSGEFGTDRSNTGFQGTLDTSAIDLSDGPQANVGPSGNKTATVSLVTPKINAGIILALRPAVPAPFYELDWPNPRGYQRAVDLLSYMDASEFWMLRDTFFGAPGQPPTYDYPNPQRRRWQPPADYSNLVALLGGVAAPFRQLDWPVPRSALARQLWRDAYNAGLYHLPPEVLLRYLLQADQRDFSVRGAQRLFVVQRPGTRLWVATRDPRSFIASRAPRVFTVRYPTTRSFVMAKILPQKALTETVPVTFDFTPDLAPGVTLASVVSVVATQEPDGSGGTDGNPSAILNGAPTLLTPVVVQSVTGGLDLVDYRIAVTAQDSNGNRWTQQAILPVRVRI